MQFLYKTLLSLTTVALGQNTDAINIEKYDNADVSAVITAANPANKTFDTGVYEVQTFTFEAKADVDDGDYVRFYDSSGTAWAVALDKDGVAAGKPTGAIWTAIAAAKKANCDISGATSAADVAAAVELCVDGITGLTAVITTDDTAADGTMTFTQVAPGPTTDPTPKNTGDTTAGGILAVETTAGVATEVSVSANTVTVPAHGYATGMKISGLTTTGTLPAGLALATVYYAIVVDANTLKFATSQANALAGTAVDITGYGSNAGTHTITVETTVAGSVKLQKNYGPYGSDLWFDVASSSQNFSGSTVLNWAISNVAYRGLRAVVTTTSGTVTAVVYLQAKGT